MEFLDYVNPILFWFLVCLLVWQVYILLFHRGVPNIGTAPALRKAIIGIIKKDFDAHTCDGKSGGKPYTIIDLGSGSGKFTRRIARHLPQARVIGLEASPQSVWWSLRFKEWRGFTNLEYHRVDFFSYDMSQADAITMYLVIDMMEIVGKKLNKDLRPGTLVVSNRFKLGDGWTPIETVHVKTLFIHQKELYIYRKA